MKWLIALALIVAAYLNYPMPAHAQGRGLVVAPPATSYSPELAAKREMLLRQLYNAHRCMYDGSIAMFRQGVTTRPEVTAFTAGICAKGAAVTLRANGYNQDEAVTMILAMSDRAYDDAISWGQK